MYYIGMKMSVCVSVSYTFTGDNDPHASDDTRSNVQDLLHRLESAQLVSAMYLSLVCHCLNPVAYRMHSQSNTAAQSGLLI
jgi:hypothetical protein